MHDFHRESRFRICLLLLILPFTLFGQTDQMVTDDPIYPADRVAEGWFEVLQITDHVWRIDDHGRDNIYLVEGDEKALLIDTGTGVADLKGLVESMTDLPVVVVNTHAHPDHCGGNHQFEMAYVHPADLETVAVFDNQESHADAIQQALQDEPDLSKSILRDADSYKDAELIPVKAGYLFDLGNRMLEVIEVPGHTPGSICLLDSKAKLLFVGDNNNTIVWLFLDGCLPLEVYLEVLQKQNQRSNEFDTILCGHGDPLDAGFIEEQIVCARNILNGSCKGEPYETFFGQVPLCTYKRAGIAFDPENLWVKK
ncbi:MBL fold metallo-hydrolase [candidate division KSB1 bacterium]|nr:MBL fold metallo-hydrolase [candidate division KSB1 bacterium]